MYNIYRVGEEKTLQDIANKFGITLKDLQEVNNRTSDLLREDEEIIIPEPSKRYFDYYTIKQGDKIFMGNNEYKHKNTIHLIEGVF